jgi:hypothetical protein
MVYSRRIASDEVTIRRALRVETAVACALTFVASTVLIFGMSEGVRSFAGSTVSAAALTFLFVGGLMRRRPRWYAGPVGLELTSNAIFVRGRTVRERYTTEELREGWVEGDGPCLVRLRMVSGDVVTLRVPRLADAEGALRALRVSAEDRVLRMPLACPAARSPGGLSLVIVTLLLLAGMLPFVLPFFFETLIRTPISTSDVFFTTAASSGGLALLVLDVFGLYKCAQLLSSPCAVIGTDGVAIHGIGRHEFVRYTDVVDCREGDGEAELRLRGGSSVVLPVTGKGIEETGRLTTALVRRLRQAMTVGPRRTEAAHVAWLVTRGDRSLRAWANDLAPMARAEESGYRDLPFGRSDFVAMMEDADAPADLRVVSVAALALAGAMDSPTLRRLRAAVDTCANEALRFAMERAAYGYIDEQALYSAKCGETFG